MDSILTQELALTAFDENTNKTILDSKTQLKFTNPQELYDFCRYSALLANAYEDSDNLEANELNDIFIYKTSVNEIEDNYLKYKEEFKGKFNPNYLPLMRNHLIAMGKTFGFSEQLPLNFFAGNEGFSFTVSNMQLDKLITNRMLVPEGEPMRFIQHLENGAVLNIMDEGDHNGKKFVDGTFTIHTSALLKDAKNKNVCLLYVD